MCYIISLEQWIVSLYVHYTNYGGDPYLFLLKCQLSNIDIWTHIRPYSIVSSYITFNTYVFNDSSNYILYSPSSVLYVFFVWLHIRCALRRGNTVPCHVQSVSDINLDWSHCTHPRLVQLPFDNKNSTCSFCIFPHRFFLLHMSSMTIPLTDISSNVRFI